MDQMQALLAALRGGHKAITDKGMQGSNVARLALGMPEMYPEQPSGSLREAGHDYSTWNALRELLGMPPMEDPNAVSPYENGIKTGGRQPDLAAPPKINLPVGAR